MNRLPAAEELRKMANALEKAFHDLGDVEARLKKIEAQSIPPLGAATGTPTYRVVDKSEDDSRAAVPSPADLVAALAKFARPK
jgi:hypothetical protein